MPSCTEIARDLVEGGVAPRAVVGCAARTTTGWTREVGGGEELQTLFDLASLTKPMTAVAALRSGLHRDDLLRDLIPETVGTPTGDATIELLLAHRAGLAAHLPLFESLARGETPAAMIAAAANGRRDDARGPVPRDGFPPVYSDLGYILVGLALARHAGTRDAGEAIARWVAEPLGLAPVLGAARELEAQGVDVLAKAAPTEDVAWRGGIVRGRVHDENAWMLTGTGGSGHAGIFGTIGATLTFGCAVLDAVKGNDTPWSLSPADVAWLVRERPGGTVRAGFDGKSLEGSSAGERFGPRSFGHLGFTGTSLWIDPDADIVAVVLTNRVHPTRDNLRIRHARPHAHDALFARAERIRVVP